MKSQIALLVILVFFAVGFAPKIGISASRPEAVTFPSPTPEMKSAAADQTPESQEDIEPEFLDNDLDYLDEEVEEAPEIADPIYYWNKGMYHFNDKLYFWVLKPVARGYRFVVPEVARTGIRNFFRNLTTPIRFVNSLLQGKGRDAGRELERFIMNTTAGVAGFGDPAKKYKGLKPKPEDMGQTLAVYGLGNGFYIVWPFLGPSTLRDSVGKVGDYFLDPVSYVSPTLDALAIRATDRVNDTSFRIGDYESLKEAAIDPYIAIRDAYIQNRNKKIAE